MLLPAEYPCSREFQDEMSRFPLFSGDGVVVTDDCCIILNEMFQRLSKIGLRLSNLVALSKRKNNKNKKLSLKAWSTLSIQK